MALEFLTPQELPPALIQDVSDFLDGQHTSHLFQFPQWAGPRTRLVLHREAGKVRWAGIFGIHAPLGRKVPWIRAFVANRGPVCDDRSLWQSVMAELVESAKRQGFAYLDVSPDWIESTESNFDVRSDSSSWECVDQKRTSLRLDLTKSEEELFGNFRKNTRYEIRRAERSQVKISFASTAAEISEFLLLYQRMADRKGFSAESIEVMRGLINWLIHKPSRGALLLARLDNATLGGSVIGRACRRCWYIWGASERYEQVNVGHILQWKALLWAKFHGCAEYDFGGYTPGATSGPAWFKAGFGGSVVNFVAPRRTIAHPGRYRAFRLLSKMSDQIRGD